MWRSRDITCTQCRSSNKKPQYALACLRNTNFWFSRSWVGKCIKNSNETVEGHNPRPTQATKNQRRIRLKTRFLSHTKYHFTLFSSLMFSCVGWPWDIAFVGFNYTIAAFRFNTMVFYAFSYRMTMLEIAKHPIGPEAGFFLFKNGACSTPFFLLRSSTASELLSSTQTSGCLSCGAVLIALVS